MRGATCQLDYGVGVREFQSTLLMRGATSSKSTCFFKASISIHAPHARSDAINIDVWAGAQQFQSTLLMRGATFASQSIRVSLSISIHAPHARSDRHSQPACRLPDSVSYTHLDVYKRQKNPLQERTFIHCIPCSVLLPYHYIFYNVFTIHHGSS